MSSKQDIPELNKAASSAAEEITRACGLQGSELNNKAIVIKQELYRFAEIIMKLTAQNTERLIENNNRIAKALRS